MRNPLSKKIVSVQPSGIRKFFDVANEMEDVISLVLENRISTRHGEYVKKEFFLWKREEHFIHLMQD